MLEKVDHLLFDGLELMFDQKLQFLRRSHTVEIHQVLYRVTLHYSLFPQRGLSLEILVYCDFRMKCKVQQSQRKQGGKGSWVIINNGEIEYSYSEAEKRGISRASFMRSITELVEKGFINITHSGSGGIKGDKTKYAISERWRDWGTDNFVKKTRPRDTRSGRGFAVFWRKKKANMGIKSDNPSVIKNHNP